MSNNSQNSDNIYQQQLASLDQQISTFQNLYINDLCNNELIILDNSINLIKQDTNDLKKILEYIHNNRNSN
jgi:hypothetical protein